jgi:hypothetical protein
MRTLSPLWRWLSLAALADWLITRSVTRAAIHMPKTPLLITGYEGLAILGQWASTFAALLALIMLGWIAWRLRREWWQAGLWGGLLAFHLAFLFIAPAGVWTVMYHGWLLGLLGVMAGQVWRATAAWATRLGVALTAFSLSAGVVYQLLPALYTALDWPGPAPLVLPLFNLGELGVALVPLAFWWMARPATIVRHHYAWALLPAAVFTIGHLVNPSMTAILSIWSTGLTLYLPWPLYALSLYAASVVALHGVHHDWPLGWAMVLLTASGYAPQLGAQVAGAWLGLWLLTQPQPSPTEPAQCQPEALPMLPTKA